METASPEVIARKRAQVDAAFGPGAFDESVKKIRPHRCNNHLEDALVGLSEYELLVPMKRWLDCLWSKPGQEPERLNKKSIPFGATSADKPIRLPIYGSRSEEDQLQAQLDKLDAQTGKN